MIRNLFSSPWDVCVRFPRFPSLHWFEERKIEVSGSWRKAPSGGNDGSFHCDSKERNDGRRARERERERESRMMRRES